MRIRLINVYGIKLLEDLSRDYPEYDWFLTLINGVAQCVGFKDGVKVAVGRTYEDIVNNL